MDPKDVAKFDLAVSAEVARLLHSKARAKFKGHWEVECVKPNGDVRWKEDVFNLVTNEGLDWVLDRIFNTSAVTAITTWYVALFESDTTILATHTYAVPGYTECSSYDEAARQEFDDVASSSQSISNSGDRAQFTISATKTLYGASLVGATAGNITTPGNTDATNGCLLCAVQFSASRAVYDDDVVNVTYTLTAADDGA